MVKNLNISADDITLLKFGIQWASFVKFSRCQIFGPIGKYYFQTESVDFLKLCSVPNKIHVEVP